MIRFDVDNETADRLPNPALDALLVGVSPLPGLFSLSALRVTGSASAKSTASISAGSGRPRSSDWERSSVLRSAEPTGQYNRRKLADQVFGDFWQRVPLELLDAFALLTDRSGSRPTARIQLAPPPSLRCPAFSGEAREIRACARVPAVVIKFIQWIYDSGH